MTTSVTRKSFLNLANSDNEDGVRLGYLAESIAFHLRLAQIASFRKFVQLVGDRKLKPGQFAMLALIDENPGISQSALGLASGRDSSSLTSVLDSFVRQKLVTRQRVPHNRRRYTLSLTAAGRALQEDMKKLAKEHDNNINKLFDRDSKNELLRLLRRITMALV